MNRFLLYLAVLFASATVFAQNKSSETEKAAIREYEEALLKYVTAELPESWINEEVNNRMRQIMQNPQYLANPEAFWTQTGKTEEQFKKDLKEESEKSLKVFLGLSKVIEAEKIEIEPNEMKELEIMLAAQMQKTPQTSPEVLKEKMILNRKIDKHLRAQVLSA